MDRHASQALDDWSHAIHALATAVQARVTAERLHADALAAPHPFKSRIGRSYARLVSAIVREEAAEDAEAAARQRFGRASAVLDRPPVEPRPARPVADAMPVQRDRRFRRDA